MTCPATDQPCVPYPPPLTEISRELVRANTMRLWGGGGGGAVTRSERGPHRGLSELGEEKAYAPTNLLGGRRTYQHQRL